MSIMGVINNPLNQQEEFFNFSVASEKVYNDYWVKFAREKNMVWLPLFIDGNIIESQYFGELKNELYSFKCFLSNNPDNYYYTIKESILERIDSFIEHIKIVEEIRPDIELYVG